MFYLKCSKCGHFNEVKSEYLIFCAGCNKKLDNNYSDWSKRNPEKSFGDYKKLICVTEIEQIPEKKQRSFKPKGLKYWIGLVVVLAVCYVIGYFGGNKIIAVFKDPNLNQELMAVASEINKSCPFMADKETRLDNAVVMKGNTLQYNYTLVNMVKDSINIEKIKTYLEPNIINTVKSNPELKIFRDNKVTLNYSYKDKTGIYLFTISVKPDQYQE